MDSGWFNERIREHIFCILPESAFHDHRARMVLVNNLHYFLQKKRGQMTRQGYNLRFKTKVNHMIGYLISQQPYVREIYRQVRKALCTGLKSIMGKEEIARAIVVQDPNLANYSPSWWAPFDASGPLSVSVRLTIAMCVKSRSLTRDLLPLLPDSWTQIDAVFGDPLTNAIKLGNMALLDVAVQQLSTRQLVPKSAFHQHYTGYIKHPHIPRSAFPVKEAVDTAILRNRTDMVAALLQLYYDQFGAPSNTLANKWLTTILKIGNPQMVRTMYASHLPRDFLLDYRNLIRLCHVSDYNLVFETLNPLKQNLWSRNARQDPLNTAVRHKNIDTATAILDTGRVDINSEVVPHGPGQYNGRAMIAPLDAACLNEDVAMLEFLLRRGANYHRRFAVTLNGQCYYKIHNWATRPENGGFSYMPEYGHYCAMSREDQLAYVFG